MAVLLAVLAFGLVTQVPAAREWYFCWKFERARTSGLREYWARAILGLPNGRGVEVLRLYALGPDEQQAVTAAIILWIGNVEGADEAWQEVEAAWSVERRRAFESELLSRVAPVGPDRLPAYLPGLLTEKSVNENSVGEPSNSRSSGDNASNAKSANHGPLGQPPTLPDWAKPMLEEQLKRSKSRP